MSAALEPLRCPSCSAPVPLGEGDAVACPFCDATVAIPESIRRVRALHRVAEADRARVEALYRGLGEPPGPMLRFWTASGGLVLAILRGGTWISALTILGAPLWLHDWLLDRAPALGFDPVDVLGPLLFAALGALALHLLVVAPFIYGTWRNATGSVRNRLSASLAARPARLPGAASTCRQCGAPLSVPPGALGARCDYCGADNLVRLPPEFVKRWARDDLARHAHVVSAVEAEQGVVRQANRRALRGALVGLATLVASTALWTAVATLDHDTPGSYRDAIAAAPRRVFLTHYAAPAPPPEPHVVGRPVAIDPRSRDCVETVLFRGPDACERNFWVALRGGEQLRIATKEIAAIAAPRMGRDRFEYSHAHYGDWGPSANGVEATLIAPYSGWFNVALLVPLPDGPTEFTFEILPARGL
jgi:LSD1 subclass zinc finger protein